MSRQQIWIWITIAGLSLLGPHARAQGGSDTVNTSTPTKQIDDLRWKGKWMSNMGCLQPCLEYLDRDVPWSWLYGASGWAFVLNIHEELCPSGWHCADFPLGSLAENAGAQVDWFSVGPHEFPSDEDRPGRQKDVWAKTRAALDKGQPCIGYDLEIGDYYVVYGYDDTGYYYSGPKSDAGKGPLPWQDLGVTGQVGLISMGAVGLADLSDDRTTVRKALEFAVKHAGRQPKPDDIYHSGLAAYDQWIRALEAGHTNGWGPAYNAVCYLECRQFAVSFLTEAKDRLDGDLGPLFDKAIGDYQEVVRSLKKVTEAFPVEDANHEPDKEAVKKGIAALRSAKQAEAEGIDALARLLTAGLEVNTTAP